MYFLDMFGKSGCVGTNDLQYVSSDSRLHFHNDVFVHDFHCYLI